MKTKFSLPCFTFAMVYPLNKVLKEHNIHKISVKRNKSMPNHGLKKFTKIDHFHIHHNAHFLTPKLCIYISIMFDFSWEDHNTQDKMERIVMQNFGG